MQPARRDNVVPETEDPGLDSTKQILKEHMLDVFFEQALDQLKPGAASEIRADEVFSYQNGFEISDVELVAGVLERDPERALEEPAGDANLEPYGDSLPEEAGDAFEQAVMTVKEEENQVQEKRPAGGNVPASGFYIVAIALVGKEIQLPAQRVDPGFPLFSLPFGKAQAIVSRVPLEVYSEESLQDLLNEPGWVERTQNKHDQILAQIQSQISILPMRACTVCESREELEAFLIENHDVFVSTLRLIEDNVSWRFNIYCNEPRLRTLTARASNRVRAIQAELAGKSQAAAQSVQERLAAVLEEEARSVCRACVKHSHGILSSIAEKKAVHALKGSQVGDAHKRGIFRCDYLVPLSQRDAFNQELIKLIASYKSLGFELEAEGPFPPVQFVQHKVLPAWDNTEKASESVGTNLS